MKPTNKMNHKQLMHFNIFVSVGIIIMNLLFNLPLILNKMTYYMVAKYVLIISLVFFLLNFLLISINKNTLKFTSYIIGTLMGNLTIFSMYLLALNYLKPESMITKTMLLLNFVVVESILIYRRLIKRDIDYISCIKSGNHGKYVKKDIIVSLFISTIVIILAKLLDVNPLNIYTKKVDVLLSSFIIMIITMIGVVLHVTGIANYIYAEKQKK